MREVNSYLPFLSMIFPILGSFIVGIVGMKSEKLRNLLAVIISLITLFFIVSMVEYVFIGSKVIKFTLSSIVFGTGLSFYVDRLSLVLAIVASSVWFLATLYSINYMSHETNRNRYYFFWFITLGATLGILLAQNFFTLFIFFEILGVFAYPLIVHSKTDEAKKAGTKYLYMTLVGGLALLSGILLLNQYSGSTNIFMSMENIKASDNIRILIAVLLIAGFGVKAGMIPLHVWLPDAHPVAPSPASALLSGVMIKTGAYGILRTVYFTFTPELFLRLGLSKWLLALALGTMIVGSAAALKQKEIKRLLAYSSVAQMGYILTGIALLSRLSVLGSILHIINHALMKSALFLCAGAIIYKTNLRNIDDLKGIGRRMPVTVTCFSIAALSMIGIPPFAGFVSKWYLALGALQASNQKILSFPTALMVIGFLLFSSILNLIYYGRILLYAWQKNDSGKDEVGLLMLLPIIVLVIGIIVFGVYPDFLISIVLKGIKGV